MSVRGPIKHSKCNASNSHHRYAFIWFTKDATLTQLRIKTLLVDANCIQYYLPAFFFYYETMLWTQHLPVVIIQYNHTSVMKLGRVAAKFFSVGFATVVCLDVSSIISILGLAELTEVKMRHQLCIEKCRLVAWWISQLMIPISREQCSQYVINYNDREW